MAEVSFKIDSERKPTASRFACFWSHGMELLTFAVALALSVAPTQVNGQTSTVLGDWREPQGSVIRIEKCPSGVCLRLIGLSRNAPSSTDVHNPDPTQRQRALCGLEIGRQFHFTDPSHASGGTLYDPKSGNTYHGAMVVEGDVLKLRGYVGISIFGRTEVWRRAPAQVKYCRDTGTH